MRIILIDNNSGFVWGDTADFAGDIQIETMAQAAELLDESFKIDDRVYVEARSNRCLGNTGYHCYRASIDAPIVHDGQDKQTIDDISRNYEYLGFVHAVTIN